ncbi:hypothetical protein [Lactococcus lactis]|uniref:hypothetical protein n=1 Tax=Lactococcus lactis TaxID=1358 RepID=UPI00289228D2|nr:hypothetical protein [Lactococcus lactis]MDT2887594.1 hypothetical protein [Lactococcus lactis]MDT2930203.1 hypothetical protein [Lactococcus lactis]
MQETNIIIEALKREKIDSLAIQSRAKQELSDVEKLPYAEQRQGERAKAIQKWSTDNSNLVKDTHDKVDVLIQNIEKHIQDGLSKGVDNETINTLNLWLMAKTVTQSEIDLLCKQYSGQALALRIVNQIAEKHRLNIDYTSYKTLDDYLKDVNDYKILVDRAIRQLITPDIEGDADLYSSSFEAVIRNVTGASTVLDAKLEKVLISK